MLLRLKRISVELRLLAVLSALFLFSASLGEKSAFFSTLSFPLLLFSASLCIWLYVRKMNLNRRIIGGLTIVMLLSLLLRDTPFAHFVNAALAIPLVLLAAVEYTRFSGTDVRACLLWLVAAPSVGALLISTVAGDNIWFQLTALPVAWIAMARYAEHEVYAKSLKFVVAALTLLVLGLIVSADALALHPLLELIKNEEARSFLERATSGNGLPALHLLLFALYLPILAISVISYYVSKQKAS